MTSPSIAELIAQGDPLTPSDWNQEMERLMRAERERVRQRSVALYSASPLYQARAAKDQDFWKTFSVGGSGRNGVSRCMSD